MYGTAKRRSHRDMGVYAKTRTCFDTDFIAYIRNFAGFFQREILFPQEDPPIFPQGRGDPPDPLQKRLLCA